MSKIGLGLALVVSLICGSPVAAQVCCGDYEVAYNVEAPVYYDSFIVEAYPVEFYGMDTVVDQLAIDWSPETYWANDSLVGMPMDYGMPIVCGCNGGYTMFQPAFGPAFQPAFGPTMIEPAMMETSTYDSAGYSDVSVSDNVSVDQSNLNNTTQTGSRIMEAPGAIPDADSNAAVTTDNSGSSVEGNVEFDSADQQQAIEDEINQDD